MSADITWLLAGVDTRRWNVQAGSLWRPGANVRRSVLTVPNRHGTVRTGRPPVFEEPVVSLELRCKGAMSSLEAAANELMALLTAPGLVLGRSSGGLTTSAPVDFVTASPGQFVADVVADFSVQLAVPGVFFRTASVDSTPEVVTSPEVVTLAALGAGTAPVTDAVLRIRGAGSAFSVVDAITGTGISWSGTALTGSEYLFINMASLTARRSTSSTAWASGGTDASGGLSYPAVGPLQIWPRMAAADPAARAARVTVTGTGFDATTALTVRAAPAYL